MQHFAKINQKKVAKSVEIATKVYKTKKKMTDLTKTTMQRPPVRLPS